jgi:hypothetical protein
MTVTIEQVKAAAAGLKRGLAQIRESAVHCLVQGAWRADQAESIERG